MKVKYFADTDTLYIELRPDGIADTHDLDEDTLLELDAAGNLEQLVSVIRLTPAQLGNPDYAAAALSSSLDEAVRRLSDTQRRLLAQTLDLPPAKAGRNGTRWNQAAKRALLVIATAVMFHSRLDSHLPGMRPEMDARSNPPEPFNGPWPPAMAHLCLEADDPIAAFRDAWNLILALDYKPIFETGRAAVQACPPDPAFANAIRDTARAALAVVQNIAGLRHDQFSRDEERKIKAREKELFAAYPNYMAGNSGAFLVLANYISKPDTGTIAAVLPLTGATDKSGHGIRKYLGRHYHVELIVTSHDPGRIYFSENTNIGEMLLVCRRWPGKKKDKPPTRVVNLAQNPATPAEAITVARAIENGTVANQNYGTMQEWPASKIAVGDWGAVQFLSPYLCQRSAELAQGDLFPSTRLEAVAEIGPEGRRTRDAFTRSNMPDAEGRVALWQHETDIIQTMAARPDTHLIAKPSKAHLADRYWQQRSRMLLPIRLFLPSTRLSSVLVDTPCLGSAWVPCRVKRTKSQPEQLEMALCAYLNSSVGILAALGERSNRKPTYPRFSLDDLRNLPVPDFAAIGANAAAQLAAAYDAHASDILLPLPQIDSDPTRRALDAAVTAALGLDGEETATIRRHLASEPSVTGRRYGS